MESGLRILEVRHRETHASTRFRIARGVPFAEDGQLVAAVYQCRNNYSPARCDTNRTNHRDAKDVVRRDTASSATGRVRRERHSRGRRSHFHRMGLGAAQNVVEASCQCGDSTGAAAGSWSLRSQGSSSKQREGVSSRRFRATEVRKTRMRAYGRAGCNERSRCRQNDAELRSLRH